jgi:hypothetical protein
MQKWEYLNLQTLNNEYSINGESFIGFKPKENSLNIINQLGTEGWELVSAFAYHLSDREYMFKRPINE